MQRMTPFAAFLGAESDPAHSPAITSPEGGEYGLPLETSTHRPYADEHNGWWEGADCGIRPKTDVGGRPGYMGMGYTTGLRPRRERRPLLDGSTLVVPPNQARNPNVGSVGFDVGRAGFSNRVEALSGDYLPSLDVIAASFTQPSGSALMREIAELGDA